MQNATILYLVDTATRDDAIAEIAERACNAGMYLRCMLFAPVPIMPFTATGGMAYGTTAAADHWPEHVAEVQTAMKARAQEIEGVLAKAEVSGTVSTAFCIPPDIKTQVSAFSRTSDIMLIAQNLREKPDVFGDFVHAALFESPIGVLLNGKGLASLDHIFLAWDDSDAAASAVHRAMPILKASKQITVGCFDPVTNERGAEAEPGADLAAWLTRHGCTVTVAHYPSGGKEIGACILDKSSDLGTDLVVMGAYGHSRMRQAIFGGTTRTMLEQTGQAVFLAH